MTNLPKMQSTTIKLRALHGLVWALLVLCLTPSTASAELIIEDDGGAPAYTVELEPHGVLTPFWPPRGAADVGIGAGVMVGINLAPRGFIPTINDSVALGLGFDWVNYFGGRAGISECAEWRGTGNEAICVRTRGGGGGAGTYFFMPAVMQWNFYLTDSWSVFGEPGLALYLNSNRFDNNYRFGLTPVFNAGGRWHFSEPVTLTFRVGYPYTTVGLSIYF